MSKVIPQALVLAPTREVAVQIQHVITSIGSQIAGLKCCVVIGGMSVKEDRHRASQQHIVVGTPGRIKDLISTGSLPTSSLRIVVMDEADQLFQQVKCGGEALWILNRLPSRRQTLMLSATYSAKATRTVSMHMRDPQFVFVSADEPSLAGVKQYVCRIDLSSETVASGVSEQDPYVMFQKKVSWLVDILNQVQFQQCVVFSNQKGWSNDLVEELDRHGWVSTSISGDMPQPRRLEAMRKLRDFKVRVLVSTDLTARGVDIERISLVVHMDLPDRVETYIHRVGRTGRFGTLGVSIALLSSAAEDTKRLDAVERSLGTKMDPLPSPLSAIPERYFAGELLSEEDRIAFAQLERGSIIPPTDLVNVGQASSYERVGLGKAREQRETKLNAGCTDSEPRSQHLDWVDYSSEDEKKDQQSKQPSQIDSNPTTLLISPKPYTQHAGSAGQSAHNVSYIPTQHFANTLVERRTISAEEASNWSYKSKPVLPPREHVSSVRAPVHPQFSTQSYGYLEMLHRNTFSHHVPKNKAPQTSLASPPHPAQTFPAPIPATNLPGRPFSIWNQAIAAAREFNNHWRRRASKY